VLSHILDKYKRWVIPAIIRLKLGTPIFQYIATIDKTERSPISDFKAKISRIIDFLLRKS
jgi:hypothetical protein